MPAQLTAIVLIENTATDGLLSEHDLSVHLDYHKPNGGGGISHGHITASMAGVAGMNNLLTTLFVVSRFEI